MLRLGRLSRPPGRRIAAAEGAWRRLSYYERWLASFERLLLGGQ
ncbi:MAG: hypothetical protein U0841_16715 [Chloroflexia bacterium]